MSKHNGTSQTPTRDAARSLNELAGDALHLAQLQGELLSAETGALIGGFVKPVILVVGAACVGLGCVPVGLFCLAAVLEQFAGLTPAASLGISLVVGLLITGVLGLTARGLFKQLTPPYSHSREELRRNVEWLKHMLHKHSHSPEPDDGGHDHAHANGGYSDAHYDDARRARPR